MTNKKVLFVLLLVCALVPLTANATITRVIGLGGDGTNYIIKDAFNPSIWPQLVKDYPNLAGGELYSMMDSKMYKVYTNYNFGEDKCVVQFSLDRQTGIRSMFDGSLYTNASTLDPTDKFANKFSAIYGRKLGEMKVGLALSLGERSKTVKSPKEESKAMVLGANLGVSALENKLDASLGFETVSFTYEDTVAANKTESDGSMAIQIAGRYWYQYSDKSALIPNIRFFNKKDGAKMGDDTGSMTTTNIKVGVGHNWTPVENALAIFEFGIDLMTMKGESKIAGVSSDSTIAHNAFPYWRVGFETKIFPWLNGRIGAERKWVSHTSDVKPGEEEWSGSETNTYLGATTHWNRLNLDLLVQPMFLQNGPYFVSGMATDIFSRVSLKYDFNN